MISLNDFEVEAKCPRCGFYNPLLIKDIAPETPVICRGCSLFLASNIGEPHRLARWLKSRYHAAVGTGGIHCHSSRADSSSGPKRSAKSLPGVLILIFRALCFPGKEFFPNDNAMYYKRIWQTGGIHDTHKSTYGPKNR